MANNMQESPISKKVNLDRQGENYVLTGPDGENITFSVNDVMGKNIVLYEHSEESGNEASVKVIAEFKENGAIERIYESVTDADVNPTNPAEMLVDNKKDSLSFVDISYQDVTANEDGTLTEGDLLPSSPNGAPHPDLDRLLNSAVSLGPGFDFASTSLRAADDSNPGWNIEYKDPQGVTFSDVTVSISNDTDPTINEAGGLMGDLFDAGVQGTPDFSAYTVSNITGVEPPVPTGLDIALYDQLVLAHNSDGNSILSSQELRNIQTDNRITALEPEIGTQFGDASDFAFLHEQSFSNSPFEVSGFRTAAAEDEDDANLSISELTGHVANIKTNNPVPTVKTLHLPLIGAW